MLKASPLFSSLKFAAPFLQLQHPSTPPRFPLHSAAATLTWVRSNCAGASSSSVQTPSEMGSETYMFGPYKIDPREVFYSTQLSYALVNLRPLVPGHILRIFRIWIMFSGRVELLVSYADLKDVLVCPRRKVKRFLDLDADETSDLWLTAQKVGSQLESYHNSSSLTFAIQDGPQAGQTVPHVHIHVLPRKGGDFEKNDDIYDALDSKEKELKQKLDLDKERKDRSIAEMTEEADEYRKLFL